MATLWRSVPGFLVVGDVTGHVVEVTGPGADVWALLAEPIDEADVVGALSERYAAAPGEIEADVRAPPRRSGREGPRGAGRLRSPDDLAPRLAPSSTSAGGPRGAVGWVGAGRRVLRPPRVGDGAHQLRHLGRARLRARDLRRQRAPGPPAHPGRRGADGRAAAGWARGPADRRGGPVLRGVRGLRRPGRCRPLRLDRHVVGRPLLEWVDRPPPAPPADHRHRVRRPPHGHALRRRRTQPVRWLPGLLLDLVARFAAVLPSRARRLPRDRSPPLRVAAVLPALAAVLAVEHRQGGVDDAGHRRRHLRRGTDADPPALGLPHRGSRGLRRRSGAAPRRGHAARGPAGGVRLPSITEHARRVRAPRASGRHRPPRRRAGLLGLSGGQVLLPRPGRRWPGRGERRAGPSRGADRGRWVRDRHQPAQLTGRLPDGR